MSKLLRSPRRLLAGIIAREPRQAWRGRLLLVAGGQGAGLGGGDEVPALAGAYELCTLLLTALRPWRVPCWNMLI